ALVAGCGAPETKQAANAPGKPACVPAPKELVKKDLEEGTGRAAVNLATALVYYTGWLYDECAPDHKGAQFDSNVGKRIPFGFRVGAGTTIRGWAEGWVGMREGGKRFLVTPSNLG